MSVESGKCKCGCGNSVNWPSDYLPGHDAIHRSKLIDKAGGVDKLEQLLQMIDDYKRGQIDEPELAKGIRRLAAG